MGYEAISLLEALNGLAVAPRRPKQRRAITVVGSNASETVGVSCQQNNTVITFKSNQSSHTFKPYLNSQETVINVTDENVEPSTVDNIENDAVNGEMNTESFNDMVSAAQSSTSPLNTM